MLVSRVVFFYFVFHKTFPNPGRQTASPRKVGPECFKCTNNILTYLQRFSSNTPGLMVVCAFFVDFFLFDFLFNVFCYNLFFTHVLNVYGSYHRFPHKNFNACLNNNIGLFVYFFCSPIAGTRLAVFFSLFVDFVFVFGGWKAVSSPFF